MTAGRPKAMDLKDFERHYLVFKEMGLTDSRIAKLLFIDRKTVYLYKKKLGITLKLRNGKEKEEC